MIRPSLLTALAGVLFAAGSAPGAQPPLPVTHAPRANKNVNDPAARALALLLKPLGLTPKADKTGLARVQAQEAKILDVMEQSEAKGGPGAEQLLERAYSFVPEVGPTQRDIAVAALTNAWRVGRALGVFDVNHHFSGEITLGDDIAKKVIFEYIVPLSEAPEFSQDVTNIRLIAPSMARNTPDSLNSRDRAYNVTLQSVSREVEGMKKLAAITDGGQRNTLGEPVAVAEALWKAEMDREGAAALGKPNIILSGEVMATPSRHNGDAWHLQASVKNLSQHATEVDVECFVIGSTWKKRTNFLMLHNTQTLHLRSSEEELVDFVTPTSTFFKKITDDYENLDPKKERPKSHVYYRGAVFRVNHAKDVAAVSETTDSMAKYLDKDSATPISALPDFSVDPKAPKPKPKAPAPKPKAAPAPPAKTPAAAQ